MKRFTKASAALLSIVMINTIGSEDAGAFDAGAYDCYSECGQACQKTVSELDWFSCYHRCKELPDECPKRIKPQGRVKKGTPGSATTLTICEAAQKAWARNSPAAPGLQAKCDAAGAAGGTGTTDK